jgi:exodeoxyribonuclease VII small subunit
LIGRGRIMAKGKELNYSTALAELEEIIGSIESDAVDVDTLAEKVKRASFLIRFCKDRLKGTEEDVKKIVSEME